MNCQKCDRANLTEKELEIHLKYFHPINQAIMQHAPTSSISNGICPDCGDTLWFQEGCVKCNSCGYSKC